MRPRGFTPHRALGALFELLAFFALMSVPQLVESACSAALFDAGLSFDVGSYPASVAAEDLNGDARQDVVTANRLSDNVTVLLGTGDGGCGARADYATGHYPVAVAIGDVDLDGRADLVVANKESDGVSILYGTGTGAFAKRVDVRAGDAPSSVSIGDVNLDGKPEPKANDAARSWYCTVSVATRMPKTFSGPAACSKRSAM